MTRYRLDEKTGCIWADSGYATEKENLDVLGKALCISSTKLAHGVGVPENEVYECKNGSVAAISHNLKKVKDVLDQNNPPDTIVPTNVPVLEGDRE